MKTAKLSIVLFLLPFHFFAQNDSALLPTVDYNIRLKQIADSAMISWFGDIGFPSHFEMDCMQNPCEKGYLYAGLMVSDKPCAEAPQDSCKEAIVSFRYKKEGVPLHIKMLVRLLEGRDNVYVENFQFGKKQFSYAEQSLLSIDEMENKIKSALPNDSLKLVPGSQMLSFTNQRIQSPTSGSNTIPQFSDPGYRLLKETPAGKNWQGGFMYNAYDPNPRQIQKMYYFDASTGDLLWVTEVYETTN